MSISPENFVRAWEASGGRVAIVADKLGMSKEAVRSRYHHYRRQCGVPLTKLMREPPGGGRGPIDVEALSKLCKNSKP